jgi:hypothetical protein
MEHSYQDLRNVKFRPKIKNATSNFAYYKRLKDIELAHAGLQPRSSTQANC